MSTASSLIAEMAYGPSRRLRLTRNTKPEPVLLLGDKGRIGLYMKLCDFTLLFMILQVELRLNKDH